MSTLSPVRDATRSDGFEALARLGLATRAAIYLLIGWLAVLVARGEPGKEADQRGALQEVARHTGGTVLLWVIVVGLIGYSLWRFSEAAFGVTGDGRKKGPRLKSFVRGCIYAFLAVTAVNLLVNSAHTSLAHEEQLFTAMVMTHSWGRWAIGIVGAVVIGVGAALVYEGLDRKFEKRLKRFRMTATQRKAAFGLGVVGASARGLVFGLVGVFLIRAAVDFDSHKARGLDGALRSLAPITDAGPWLLWAAAAGLVVFGIYRVIRPAGGEPDLDIRYAVLRLVPAAVLLWGIFSGIGHLLGKDATPLDQSVTDAITSKRTATWDDITQWVSLCSATLTVVVITAVAFVALRLVLRRWREAVLLVVSVAGQAAIFVCITAVVDRARPDAMHLDDAPPTSSFPSGHTGAAVALYGGLAVVAWLAAAPAVVRVLATVIAVLLPLAVGLSRMYRGMHHLTDVLGGLALSGVWLGVVTVVIVAATRQRAAPDDPGPVLAR